MDNLLRVGVISSTHGIKGEVKVFPTTDDPNRYLELKQVKLDTGRELLTLEIESVKFFKQMVILKFKGIDNINDIEKYRGKDLLIERDQAVELNEGEYFICDLIDSTVYSDEGDQLGILKDILTGAANDVYVVQMPDGKELLLPCIEDCILDIDAEKKEIKVHVLKGLL